jgi:hypothetical protein
MLDQAKMLKYLEKGDQRLMRAVADLMPTQREVGQLKRELCRKSCFS